MENNLAELKKEFEKKFHLWRKESFENEDAFTTCGEEVWQWFESKLNEYVPKSEYNSVCEMFQYEIAGRNDLTIKNIGLTEQIAELKAENERLANANINLKQATHAISKKCFSLQDKIEILEANAENEKLSAQRNNGKVVVQHLDGDFEEYDSYQEAKESILESYNDKHEGIHPDIECIKVLQEIFTIEVVSDELIQARQEERARIVEILTTYGRNNALNTHCAEIIKAITADQPTQKSCEGCEYNLDNNESWICTSCKDFSNYQPKEK